MKTIKKYSSYTAAIFLAVLFTGCYYDVAEELYPMGATLCDTSNVTYTADVLPIIQAKCYTCHSGSAPSGNVSVDNYTNLKVYADNGKLIGTISHASGYFPMPQGGNKLSSCEIATIQKWINDGTLNN